MTAAIAEIQGARTGRRPEERLLLGPSGGVITAATLGDATGWDALVNELGQPSLVRRGLRHTALPGWPTLTSICTCCSGTPDIKIRRSRLADRNRVSELVALEPGVPCRTCTQCLLPASR
jgi:hypothetical protein